MIIKNINFVSNLEKSNNNNNNNDKLINKKFNRRQWNQQGWQPQQDGKPHEGWKAPTNSENPCKTVVTSDNTKVATPSNNKTKNPNVNPVNNTVINGAEAPFENVGIFNNSNIDSNSSDSTYYSYGNLNHNDFSKVSIDGNSNQDNRTSSTITTVSIVIAIIALVISGGFIFIYKKRSNNENNDIEENNNSNNSGNNENNFPINDKNYTFNTNTYNFNEGYNTLQYEQDHGVINAFHDLIMYDECRSSVSFMTDDDERQLIRKMSSKYKK
ncbi:hypothetical protein U3516DRAFT_829985 [Neocallimastix sp. 'constans']